MPPTAGVASELTLGVARILELAFSRRIVRIACAGDKVDLSTLLFDPAEIRNAAREVRQISVQIERDFESELIDLNAARRRLQVNKTTMEELVDSGIIPSEGLLADPTKLFVRAPDLDAFVADHVSAGQLAVGRKITAHEVVVNLIGLGVQPTMKARFKADWFYTSRTSRYWNTSSSLIFELPPRGLLRPLFCVFVSPAFSFFVPARNGLCTPDDETWIGVCGFSPNILSPPDEKVSHHPDKVI